MRRQSLIGRLGPATIEQLVRHFEETLSYLFSLAANSLDANIYRYFLRA